MEVEVIQVMVRPGTVKKLQANVALLEQDGTDKQLVVDKLQADIADQKETIDKVQSDLIALEEKVETKEPPGE